MLFRFKEKCNLLKVNHNLLKGICNLLKGICNPRFLVILAIVTTQRSLSVP